jgi:hypothetical protein
VFAALESGTTALSRAELAKGASDAELGALRAARVVQAGRPLTSWPCDRREARCDREVMKTAAGGASPFVAVCEGSCEQEDRCVDVDLTADDLARVTLDVGALVGTLRSLYGLEGPAPTWPAGASAPVAPEPVVLGEERAEPSSRDVWLALRPERSLLAALLEARERAARPTLVLVPTGRALTPAMTTRYAPGAHVEIEVLADTVVVRDAKLARVARLRLVTPVSKSPGASLAEPVDAAQDAASGASEDDAQDAGTPREGGIAAQLGAARFADIGIKFIDGHTVRITHARRYVHASYIDLGLATSTRNPSREWGLLAAVCAGRGQFRWKNYGNMTNAKQRVSVLQAKLRAAFGLDDNPFHKFRVVDGWRAKFFARSDINEPEG